jgi:hypothetical protein
VAQGTPYDGLSGAGGLNGQAGSHGKLLTRSANPAGLKCGSTGCRRDVVACPFGVAQKGEICTRRPGDTGMNARADRPAMVITLQAVRVDEGGWQEALHPELPQASQLIGSDSLPRKIGPPSRCKACSLERGKLGGLAAAGLHRGNRRINDALQALEILDNVPKGELGL